MHLRRRTLSAVSAVFLLSFVYACGDGGIGPQNNPTPGITSLTPGFVDQGRPTSFMLTVNGNDFVQGSVVRVNGTARPTQFVSSTQLQATLPSSDFALFGPLQITVFNPAPGGGTSAVLLLEVGVGTSPVPTIASFTPAFFMAGSVGSTVIINGTGFVPGSVVVINGTFDRPVTFLSATQIRFTLFQQDLANAAALGIRVLNPAPGGGFSNTAVLEVRAPMPVITAVTPQQTSAGQSSFTIQVTGTGFVSNSGVRVNGEARQTTLTAPGTLEAQLTEADLRTAGNLLITVLNQAPGGGTSNAVTFSVIVVPAQITVLPSLGAIAGGTGFTLYVHGIGFVAGAEINWNGSPRPTTFINGTRLTATITNADVAVPGPVQITVTNPGASGTLQPVTFNVRPLGTAMASERLVPLLARDIAYDSVTRRIYASVPGSSPTNGNSIVSIDPQSGAIQGAAFVGSEPGRIALSDDGRFLYVGLNGASAVRRVDLPSLTPAIQWSLQPGEVAGDIEVAPGQAGTVAVSRQVPGISPPLSGVTIYDAGVARPTSSPGHTGGNRIEFLESPAVLYGYNNSHTGFEFFTMPVDASGVRHSVTTGGLIAGFSTNLVGAAGRIYGTDGSIVDAERRIEVGSFGIGADAMAIDPRMGRAYLLSGAFIHVFDLNTFLVLATIPITAPSLPFGGNTQLVRWGTDGLAFVDNTSLFLITSPLIGQ